MHNYRYGWSIFTQSRFFSLFDDLIYASMRRHLIFFYYKYLAIKLNKLCVCARRRLHALIILGSNLFAVFLLLESKYVLNIPKPRQGSKNTRKNRHFVCNLITKIEYVKFLYYFRVQSS